MPTVAKTPSLQQFIQVADTNSMRVVLDKNNPGGVRATGAGLGGRMKAVLMPVLGKLHNANVSARDWAAAKFDNDQLAGGKKESVATYGRTNQAAQDNRVGAAFQKAMKEVYGDAITRQALHQADISRGMEDNVKSFHPLSAFKIRAAVAEAERLAGGIDRSGAGHFAKTFVNRGVDAIGYKAMSGGNDVGLRELTLGEKRDLKRAMHAGARQALEGEQAALLKTVSDQKALLPGLYKKSADLGLQLTRDKLAEANTARADLDALAATKGKSSTEYRAAHAAYKATVAGQLDDANAALDKALTTISTAQHKLDTHAYVSQVTGVKEAATVFAAARGERLGVFRAVTDAVKGLRPAPDNSSAELTAALDRGARKGFAADALFKKTAEALKDMTDGELRTLAGLDGDDFPTHSDEVKYLAKEAATVLRTRAEQASTTSSIVSE